MVLKEEQLRVKALLKETITLLCKNGLKYKSGFCIEATIGITVDEDDILLVSMNETIRSELAREIKESMESPAHPDSYSRSPAHRSHRRAKRRYSGQAPSSPFSERRDSSRGSIDGDSVDSAGFGSGTPVSGLSEDAGPSSSKRDRLDQEDSKSDIVCIEIKEEPEDFDKDTVDSYLSHTGPETSRRHDVMRTSEMPGFPASGLSFSSEFPRMPGMAPGASTSVPSGVHDSSQSSMSHFGSPQSSTLGTSFGGGGDMSAGDQQGLQLGTSYHSQDGQQIGGASQSGRRHVCQDCYKGFSSADHLRRHRRTVHLGIYDIFCPVCGKGCSSTTHLRGHMALHTSQKHVCATCGKTYAYKGDLGRHVTRFHSQDFGVAHHVELGASPQNAVPRGIEVEPAQEQGDMEGGFNS